MTMYNIDNTHGLFKEKFEKARTYWQGKLAGAPEAAVFPYDGEPMPGYKKGTYESRFNQELSNKLLALSKNQDVLLYIAALAGLEVFIFKYLDKPDICIGAPVYTDTPHHYSSEKLIVFRNFLHEEMAFKQVLAEVKQAVIEGYENQHYLIENKLELPGIKARGMLFSRVIFLCENIHDKEMIKDIIHSPANDITFLISRTAAGLFGSIRYNANLFGGDTIRRIWSHFVYILEQAMADINVRLADMEILLEEEKKQILYEFIPPEAGYPVDKTLQRWFAGEVARVPRRTAVVYENTHLTFRGLEVRSCQLAKELRLQGVKKSDTAALLMENSLETAVSILGVLKAGAAYLPIDPDYPRNRIAYTLADSKTSVIITTGSLARGVEELCSTDVSTIFIDDIVRGNQEGHDRYEGGQEDYGHPGDLAYIIYTSGTTGRPKGVVIEHRGIVNYTSWRRHAYGYTEADVTLQLLSYGFDGFGSNFYSSLLSGGRLVLVPDARHPDVEFITRGIRQWHVTNMSVVPMMYRMVLDRAEPGNLEYLRFVVLAGEKAGETLITKSKQLYPHLLLVNEYGPSEASVTAAVHMGMEPGSTSVIGKAIANTRIYILSPDFTHSPIGVPGELSVAGIGVARGYLNNPELTFKKFTNNKQKMNQKLLRKMAGPGGGTTRFLEKSPPGRRRQKIYKTGDLARWMPDGTIQLLGRVDHQVKIRGIRIEPGEIENCLLEHEAVKEVVALVKETGNDNHKALHAYIVADKTLTLSEVRDFLLTRIPEYMIPSYFVQVEHIPLTPNGKVNRSALEAQGNVLKTGLTYQEPENELEKTIAHVWLDVLSVDKVGRDDIFFELGGNSHDIIKANIKLKEIFQTDIPVMAMFRYPSVRSFALYISHGDISPEPGVEMNEDKRAGELDKGKKDRMKRLQKRKQMGI